MNPQERVDPDRGLLPESLLLFRCASSRWHGYLPQSKEYTIERVPFSTIPGSARLRGANCETAFLGRLQMQLRPIWGLRKRNGDQNGGIEVEICSGFSGGLFLCWMQQCARAGTGAGTSSGAQ